MGSLKPFHDHLQSLQSKAKNLNEAGPALDALFTKEGTRLRREDEVSRLKYLCRTVAAQLESVERSELSAKHGHSQANLILSLGELVLTAIISKGRRMSAIADYRRQSPTDKQPFGLVMICIGPRGLPDDAQVVAISQLARESNRTEPEIINRLQEDSYLLFNEETFSVLISKLVTDIRDGRLCLPISSEKLSEITALNKPKLRARIIEVE